MASKSRTRHTIKIPLYAPKILNESGKEQLLNVLRHLPRIHKKIAEFPFLEEKTHGMGPRNH